MCAGTDCTVQWRESGAAASSVGQSDSGVTQADTVGDRYRHLPPTQYPAQYSCTVGGSPHCRPDTAINPVYLIRQPRTALYTTLGRETRPVGVALCWAARDAVA